MPVEVSGHTVFSSEYTRSNETYEVVVEHGSGSGTYRYNDMVMAAAAQAEPGKEVFALGARRNCCQLC